MLTPSRAFMATILLLVLAYSAWGQASYIPEPPPRYDGNALYFSGEKTLSYTWHNGSEQGLGSAQTLWVRIIGPLSERLRLNIDYDDRRAGTGENFISLSYTGHHSAYFSSLELGHFAFTTPGLQLLLYNQLFFGAKFEWTFDRHRYLSHKYADTAAPKRPTYPRTVLTALASSRATQSEQRSFHGQTRRTTLTVFDRDYIAGVYFDLKQLIGSSPPASHLRLWQDDRIGSNNSASHTLPGFSGDFDLLTPISDYHRNADILALAIALLPGQRLVAEYQGSYYSLQSDLSSLALKTHYRIGTQELDYKGLKLDIWDQADQNVDQDGTLGTQGRPYLELFGLDDNLDGRVDRSRLDITAGLLVFPSSSERHLNFFQFSDSYRIEVSIDQALSAYTLRPDIIPGSETVLINQRAYQKGADYWIDYRNGILFINLNPPPSAHDLIEIEYQFQAPKPARNQSLLGLSLRHERTPHTSASLTWVRQEDLGATDSKPATNYSTPQRTDQLWSYGVTLGNSKKDRSWSLSLHQAQGVHITNPNGQAMLTDFEQFTASLGLDLGADKTFPPPMPSYYPPGLPETVIPQNLPAAAGRYDDLRTEPLLLEKSRGNWGGAVLPVLAAGRDLSAGYFIELWVQVDRDIELNLDLGQLAEDGGILLGQTLTGYQNGKLDSEDQNKDGRLSSTEDLDNDNKLDSEDINNDGYLNQYDRYLHLKFSVPAGDNYQQLRIPLDGQSGSFYQQELVGGSLTEVLEQVEALRLTSSGPGRIVIDSIRFGRTGWEGSSGASASILAPESPYYFAPPGVASAYLQVTPESSSSSKATYLLPSNLDLAGFEQLEFYFKSPDHAGTLQLRQGENDYWEWSFAPSPSWQKVTIDTALALSSKLPLGVTRVGTPDYRKIKSLAMQTSSKLAASGGFCLGNLVIIGGRTAKGRKRRVSYLAARRGRWSIKTSWEDKERGFYQLGTQNPDQGTENSELEFAYQISPKLRSRLQLQQERATDDQDETGFGEPGNYNRFSGRLELGRLIDNQEAITVFIGHQNDEFVSSDRQEQSWGLSYNLPVRKDRFWGGGSGRHSWQNSRLEDQLSPQPDQTTHDSDYYHKLTIYPWPWWESVPSVSGSYRSEDDGTISGTSSTENGWGIKNKVGQKWLLNPEYDYYHWSETNNHLFSNQGRSDIAVRKEQRYALSCYLGELLSWPAATMLLEQKIDSEGHFPNQVAGTSTWELQNSIEHHNSTAYNPRWAQRSILNKMQFQGRVNRWLEILSSISKRQVDNASGPDSSRTEYTKERLESTIALHRTWGLCAKNTRSTHLFLRYNQETMTQAQQSSKSYAPDAEIAVAWSSRFRSTLSYAYQSSFLTAQGQESSYKSTPLLRFDFYPSKSYHWGQFTEYQRRRSSGVAGSHSPQDDQDTLTCGLDLSVTPHSNLEFKITWGFTQTKNLSRVGADSEDTFVTTSASIFF